MTTAKPQTTRTRSKYNFLLSASDTRLMQKLLKAGSLVGQILAGTIRVLCIVSTHHSASPFFLFHIRLFYFCIQNIPIVRLGIHVNDLILMTLYPSLILKPKGFNDLYAILTLILFNRLQSRFLEKKIQV